VTEPQLTQLKAEVQRLDDQGLALLPIGGEDGKRPLVRFKDRGPFPVAKIINMFEAGTATGYGIRLHDMTVLDVDSDDVELTINLLIRFGVTTMRTRTPSGGFHLYYGGSVEAALNLRAEGYPVDVKSGPNSFVVGPYSRRPGGKIYQPDVDPLVVSDLCPLHAPPSVARSARVREGSRHQHLLNYGRRLVREAATEDQLSEWLQEEFDRSCDSATSMPVSEIEGIAAWCWRLKVEGRLFNDGGSAVRVPRPALERIRGNSDADHLYVRLFSAHGHIPGKDFSLDYAAMRKAGLTDLSRERLREATKTLVDAGLLRQTAKPLPRKRKTRYRLVSLA